uniref:Uncharacterized protein n=1 Tax=Solanum lycopersicum TaxID=4081 RepID=K4BY31_SOLLC
MSQLNYMMLALGSKKSIIHPMKIIVGYSPAQSQNMGLMGGLRKHVPIIKITFLLDEIINDTWLYSSIFTVIAWVTAELTAFYMFQIYLHTFEGHLNAHFQNYGGKHKSLSIPCLYTVKTE